MKNIKTFAKSNFNLKDWFVLVDSDDNLQKPMYSSNITLVHKNQLSFRHIDKSLKSLNVLSLDFMIIREIIKQQSLIITQIQLKDVPPPYPYFNQYLENNTSKIYKINKL